MTRPLVIAAGVVAAVVAVLLMAQCERRRANEQVGRYRERAERLARDSAQAANTIRRVDSVFTADTVRLTSVLKRYVTRRDTILHELTDTVRVREFVTLTDSAIAACRVAVDSCTARVAARDSMIVLLGFQRQTDAARHRAELRRANPRFLPYVEGLVDPFDAANATARAGVEMRIAGPIRLVGAAQWQPATDSPLRALVGARVTF